MMRPLRRVGVLGAGTMGSRIAAHIANAGFAVDLLDIVIAGQPKRNAAAMTGLEIAAKQRPLGFFTGAPAARPHLQGADERLHIKLDEVAEQHPNPSRIIRRQERVWSASMCNSATVSLTSARRASRSTQSCTPFGRD